MPYWFYQIAHLFSVILLAGVTFAALAAPRPENRRLALMGSGIAAAVALVSGFGMLGIGGFGFPGWVFVKIAAWIVLAALTGLAFRRPGARAGPGDRRRPGRAPLGRRGRPEAVLMARTEGQAT